MIGSPVDDWFTCQSLVHLSVIGTPVWWLDYTCCCCFCWQVNLEVTNDALRAVAHLAMKHKTGARGLRAIMVRWTFSDHFTDNYCDNHIDWF